MKETLKKCEERMIKRVDHLEVEFKEIRAGRANPNILDRITVDYYGAPTAINQLAAVSVTEARTLTIQPWDATVLKGIERAIQTSDIGINPQNDGKTIRLIFPPLTEERRKEIVKDIAKMAEAKKVHVRNIRRDTIDDLKKLKKNGVRVMSAKENISEDASGILIESVLEGMAEYYSAELSQKIRRGMDINAQKCLCTGGGVALGFKVDETKHFQIDENTAPIVREIFETYASGKTVTEIITMMNERHVVTSRGSAFNKNSLRKMLQNKRYIGVYTYKGTEIPDGMPRIIEDDLFYKVQEIMEKNRKAPARARAKEEYLLTTKLFCGHCKEMMTGYAGTSHTSAVHHYYICNNRKKKLCDKKNVRKDFIEQLVIDECRKLLTAENIDRIAREVVAISESERDTATLKRLNKQLKDNERKKKNLMSAIMECDSDVIRKTLYEQIPTLESERKELELQVLMEEAKQVKLTIPEVKFFLNALKKGNPDSVKHQKALIAIFVNAIYLYDDKVTLIFNSGDKPVTVDTDLLSKIEAAADSTSKAERFVYEQLSSTISIAGGTPLREFHRRGFISSKKSRSLRSGIFQLTISTAWISAMHLCA